MRDCLELARIEPHSLHSTTQATNPSTVHPPTELAVHLAQGKATQRSDGPHLRATTRSPACPANPVPPDTRLMTSSGAMRDPVTGQSPPSVSDMTRSSAERRNIRPDLRCSSNHKGHDQEGFGRIRDGGLHAQGLAAVATTCSCWAHDLMATAR